MGRKATIDWKQTHLRFFRPGNLWLIVSRCLLLDFDRARIEISLRHDAKRG